MGCWIAAPVLALLGIVLLFVALPRVDCGDYYNSSPQLTALKIFSGSACLAAVIAGIRGFTTLRRQRRWSWLPSGRALAGVGFLSIFLAALLPTLLRRLLIAAYACGALVTGVALVVLVIVWLSRRAIEDAGVVLPLYLMGAGLFIIPPVSVIAVGVGNGALSC